MDTPGSNSTDQGVYSAIGPAKLWFFPGCHPSDPCKASPAWHPRKLLLGSCLDSIWALQKVSAPNILPKQMHRAAQTANLSASTTKEDVRREVVCTTAPQNPTLGSKDFKHGTENPIPTGPGSFKKLTAADAEVKLY